MIVRICTAHANELIPRDAEFGRISAHILSEKTFVKIVMTGRYRSVHGVERRGAYKLHGLVERKAALDKVTKTLQVAKRSMTLVAMVNILLDAEFLQQLHTTYTKQNFLLQTVLPVATIK